MENTVTYYYGKGKASGVHQFAVNAEELVNPLEISAEIYRQLQAEQASGKHLEWDDEGRPVAVEYGAQIWYEPRPDGGIGTNAGYRFSETCIRAPEAIKRGYDDKFYFESQLPDAPQPNYTELRQQAYPSVGEQLDLLYWDKVNGTSNWEDAIAAVKARYPKNAEG